MIHIHETDSSGDSSQVRYRPYLYIAVASDLKALSVINILFKFADDITLLVPEKKRQTFQ